MDFGAKVHSFQIDGVGFVGHLSFEAFHEDDRFPSTIFTCQRLTKTKVKIAGADGIYATNKNRRSTTRHDIRTDFVRKGRAGKHEAHRKLLAHMITKERASRMEGSFGTEKEHYHLNKIKARTKKTETLWIIFGIHTANAARIGKKMSRAREQAA